MSSSKRPPPSGQSLHSIRKNSTDSNLVENLEAVTSGPGRTYLAAMPPTHTSYTHPLRRYNQVAGATMLRRDEPTDRSERATTLNRDEPQRLSNRPAIMQNSDLRENRTPVTLPQVSAQPQNANSTIRLPETIRTHFKNATDVRMAARQTLLTTLSSRDQKEQHDWAKEFIARVAPCVEGFKWKRIDGGYQCKGGHHLISDDLLAEGKGGFWSLPSKRDTNYRWGPYYSEKHLPDLFFYSGPDPIPYGAPLYCGEPQEYAEERYHGFRLRLRLGLRYQSSFLVGNTSPNDFHYPIPRVEQSNASVAQPGSSIGQRQPSHRFHYGPRR